MEIRACAGLPHAALAPLVAESRAEGFAFLARLVAEHDAGVARFDGPGECLLGVYDGGALLAIGGVTRDPYDTEPRAGRLRHVYVRADARRRGVGRALVQALEAHARTRFATLALRTDTGAAARFYEALGWTPLPAGGTATHRRVLAGRVPDGVAAPG